MMLYHVCGGMTEPTRGTDVFCRDCGAEIRSNAEICPHCGVRQRPPNATPQADQQLKNPSVAAVLSFVVPGLGHVYLGKIFAGIFVFVMIVVLVASGVGIILAIPLWIAGVYGSYRVAKNQNETLLRKMEAITPVAQDKVIEALNWYEAEAPGRSFVKDVKRSYRNVESIEQLSPKKSEWAVNAIDDYTDAHGDDPELADARAMLVRQL